MFNIQRIRAGAGNESDEEEEVWWILLDFIVVH